MSGTTKSNKLDAPIATEGGEPVRVPIRAKEAVSNGMIPVSIGWRAGEVRYVTLAELMQLRRDKPTNFEVVPEKE